MVVNYGLSRARIKGGVMSTTGSGNVIDVESGNRIGSVSVMSLV